VAGSPSDYPEYPYAATDYTEPFRGQFHFSPQNGFMNDINAPLYYRGVYHLFFQHNPHGLSWDAAVHWGHATSTDLVHWTQQPISLEPGVQSGNLWSGSGWVDVNNATGLKVGSDDPILLFTNTDGVSIAYSIDGAKTFQMYNGGAKVITDPVESRDPKVQWDPQHNRWTLVTFRAGTGAAFYTSTNLLAWTYRGAYSANWFVPPARAPGRIERSHCRVRRCGANPVRRADATDLEPGHDQAPRGPRATGGLRQ
jgi:fructan beta-fructosidase